MSYLTNFLSLRVNMAALFIHSNLWNKYNWTNHPTCGVPITLCLLTLVYKIEPIVSSCVPCSTNRDGVHTSESVVHAVLLGLRIVRWFGHYIHRPSSRPTFKIRFITDVLCHYDRTMTPELEVGSNYANNVETTR